MEVAVYLAQARGARLEPPAPFDALALDLLENGERHRAVVRVAVRHAEDAFAVAEQLADAPRVEARIGSGHAMDLDEVIAQGVHALEIERQHLLSIPQA